MTESKSIFVRIDPSERTQKVSSSAGSYKIEDVLGGTTILGLRKNVARRLDLLLGRFNLEPFMATISFKKPREVKILISAEWEGEGSLSDDEVNEIANTIAQRLAGYGFRRITGEGFWSSYTEASQITLIQKV